MVHRISGGLPTLNGREPLEKGGGVPGKERRRVFLIKAPGAPAKRRRRELRRLLWLLVEGGFDVLDAGAATAFKEAREDDVVLVVGGDGTLSGVVNGLQGKGGRLAVFPAGLFNTFCRTYALPCTAEELSAAIRRGGGGPVPVGTVGDDIFISNASMGYKAVVAERLRRRGGAKRGLLSYAGPLLGAWRDLSCRRLSIHRDGGGGEITCSPLVCIAPDSDVEGSFLRVYLVEKVPRWLFPFPALAVFFAVPLRREIFLPGLRCLRARKIRVEGEVGAVNLDGEVACAGDSGIGAGMSDVKVIGLNPSTPPRHGLLLRHRGKRRGLKD